MLSFPTKLTDIPDEYWQENINQAGKLIDFYYDTYESFTYNEKKQQLYKHAVVYLPYGYSKDKKYNTFYLMHGGWSNENTYLGRPRDVHPFKNVLDNAIADGKIQPMIVVCPTYNNLHPKDSWDYGLALKLTNNYHHELMNDLIPAIDRQFSTYQDRNHRAFVGFSMGSVTTWYTFQYCLSAFRYLMPSSGAISDNGHWLANLVTEQGYGPKDFFIFAASGTDDFAYSGFTHQIEAMKNTDSIFKYANNEQDGNLYYLVNPGGVHDAKNALKYFYNGLIQIWKED